MHLPKPLTGIEWPYKLSDLDTASVAGVPSPTVEVADGDILRLRTNFNHAEFMQVTGECDQHKGDKEVYTDELRCNVVESVPELSKYARRQPVGPSSNTNKGPKHRRMSCTQQRNDHGQDGVLGNDAQASDDDSSFSESQPTTSTNGKRKRKAAGPAKGRGRAPIRRKGAGIGKRTRRDLARDLDEHVRVV